MERSSRGIALKWNSVHLSNSSGRLELASKRLSALPALGRRSWFLQDSKVFWPLHFNDYASSHFIGSRACIVVGPKGRNVDVVAHELMHAELFERVGYWHRFTEIPAWFDEGVAMQVDFRPRYSVPEQKGSLGGTGFVRDLKSYRQFFRGDGEQLTQHYAAAKAEVARWLTNVGRHELYERFERIRAGEGFNAVVEK
jgi:hypothetical protein